MGCGLLEEIGESENSRGKGGERRREERRKGREGRRGGKREGKEDWWK